MHISCFGNSCFDFSDWPEDCPVIVKRNKWGGKLPIAIEYTLIPVKYVIIHHTVTPRCSSFETCSEIVRGIQEFHMYDMEFHDIGYK